MFLWIPKVPVHVIRVREEGKNIRATIVRFTKASKFFIWKVSNFFSLKKQKKIPRFSFISEMFDLNEWTRQIATQKRILYEKSQGISFSSLKYIIKKEIYTTQGQYYKPFCVRYVQVFVQECLSLPNLSSLVKCL